MKGLEFQTVVIPHLHNVFITEIIQMDEEEVIKARREIFTAMTRARTHLVMSFQRQLPSEIEQLQHYTVQENASNYIT
jgi:superfamily I DNA/RNA helicase